MLMMAFLPQVYYPLRHIDMTPAINTAKRAKINFHIHTYEHDPAFHSYGEEAATKLGLETQRVFKTLIVAINSRTLAVAVLPVSQQLDLKRFAKALGVKKVAMADKKQAEKTTGYVLGGISPLGQKKRLKTIIDQSAMDYPTIYISAGRRGLEIELTAQDLSRLTAAQLVVIT